ncbi:hypothetical protein V5O48_003611 [Marasmius crinis-equi]|uniref:C2H2-type domain-containing protein n=1 Tax=Marasmius crinis-equi TaxID=585013 RepID=A0ABR3FSE7_9AGAR
MSLTIPIEDLPRLKVFAHLSSAGLPVLSITMRSLSPLETVANGPSSGIYVSFERTNENGFWSLSMKTTFEGLQTLNEAAAGGPGQEPSELPRSDPPPASGSSSATTTAMGKTSSNQEFSGPTADLSWLSSAPIPQMDNDVSMFVTQWNQEVAVPPVPVMSEAEACLQESSIFPQLTQHPPSQQSPIPFGTSPSSASPDPDDDSAISSEPTPPDEFTTSVSTSEPTASSAHPQPQRTKRTFPCTMGCTEQFSRQHDRFRHEVLKHGKQSKWTDRLWLDDNIWITSHLLVQRYLIAKIGEIGKEISVKGGRGMITWTDIERGITQLIPSPTTQTFRDLPRPMVVFAPSLL